MASATHSSELRTVRRQLAALQQRVSWLERALKLRGRAPKSVRSKAGLDREWAELDAQMTALSDYSKQERVQSYRDCPKSLEADRKKEEARAAFFRERGVEPLESDLTAIAKHLAEEAKDT